MKSKKRLEMGRLEIRDWRLSDSQSPISDLLKKQWFWLFAVLLLAILLRLPALDMLIDNDGGARAYHARLILAGEPLYSTHHTGHHLPAIYYTYATAMALFGDSAWAIQFFLLLWTLPTVYFLYRLAFELTEDWGTAVLAALFYAILSAHLQLWGQTAETELFANLWRITAVWLLVILLKRQKPSWQFVGVGLLAAIAFLYKPVFLSPLALAGLALFITGLRQRQEMGFWRTLWPRGGWLVLGFAAGLLPVLLYFASQGLLDRLLLVFTLGQSYGADNALTAEVANSAGRWLLYPLLPLFGLGVNNAALLMGCRIIGGAAQNSAPIAAAMAAALVLALFCGGGHQSGAVCPLLFAHRAAVGDFGGLVFAAALPGCGGCAWCGVGNGRFHYTFTHCFGN